MNVAAFAFSLLAATFFLHVALWQVRLPKAHTRTLLLLFLGAIPVGWALNGLGIVPSVMRLSGFWQYAQWLLFHVSMSLAYVEFYTAIEEDSPSCTILLFVEQAGQQGCDEQQLLGLIDSDFVVGSRLQSMLRGGFVRLDGQRYRLTTLGRLCARWFALLRWLYRLRLGG